MEASPARRQHRTGIVFLALVLMLSANSSALSQTHWKQLNSPIVKRPYTPYFLTPKVGFIYSNSALYFTNDSGNTWKGLGGGPVNQLYFTSLSHGYMASNWLLETFDTGNTWRVVGMGGFSSVYAAGNTIFAASGGKIIYSRDDGKNWVNTPAIGSYVSGNKDSLVFVNNFNGPLWYSTNLGTTWNYSTIPPPATLAVFCIPHCTEIMRTIVANNDKYTIQISTDYGKNWVNVLVEETGAYIAGTSCAAYISNASNPTGVSNETGVIRTTDRGQTWQYLSGQPDFVELDDFDWHNLSVTGGGAVVYAVDINSNLWRTTDGGDGTLSPSLLPTQLALDYIPDSAKRSTINLVICDTARIRFFTYNSCNYMALKNLSVEGLDSSEYTLSWRHHSWCESVTDSLLFTINPQVAGLHQVYVHAQFMSDEFYEVDTTFTFSINVTPTPNAKVMSASRLLNTNTSGTLNYGVHSICLIGNADSILLSNPSCEGIMIQKVYLEMDSSSVNDFSIIDTVPYLLNRWTSPYTIGLDFHPHQPGLKQGKLIIQTSIGNDTLPIFAIAQADTSLVMLSKDKIDFGTKPLCGSGGKDTLVLFNPGCTSIHIKNISFEPDASSANDFKETNTGSSILRGDLKAHKIFLIFKPLSAGLKSGNIIIETDFGNDTIPVFGNILEDSRTLLTKSEPMQAPLCDSADGWLHLANESCREMTIESIAVPAPFVLLPVRLPVFLAPGDSALVPVRFLPSARGAVNSTATAKIIFYQPLGNETFDTTIALTGFASRGIFEYALSQNNIIFDTLRLCDSAALRMVLYSTGCDSLDVANISFSGDGDFRVSGVGSRVSGIAPGDSVVINIFLNPLSEGNKSAAIIVHLGNGKIETIPLSAFINRPLKILSSDAASIFDFGARLTCETGDTIITLHNPGCGIVTISGVGFRGSGFGCNTTFPITLQPGEKKQIEIFIVTDTAGGNMSNRSDMSYTTDADNTLSPVIFLRKYIYPYPVHLWLDGDKTSITAGGSWNARLKSIPEEFQNVRALDFSLDYNTDLLTYRGNYSADGKNFHLPSVSAGADSVIAELAFDVSVAKEIMTTLTFGRIVLNDPSFTGCVALPLAAGTEFTYLNSCGDPHLRDFLNDLPITFSIRPNPAQDEIEIDLSGSEDLPIEIYNALGAKVYASKSFTQKIGTKNFYPGVYEVRIGNCQRRFMKLN